MKGPVAGAILGVGLVVLAMVEAGAGAILADNPPHQAGAGVVADSCAGCHRTHTAQADGLLTEDQPALCYSCHGAGGTGANTVVEEGKLYGGAASFTALKAGGFVYALIDTDSEGTPGPTNIFALEAPEPVTSAHAVDGSPGTAWGNGETATGPGLTNFELRCGSCHDPHGNGQYRSLRPIPPGSGGAGQTVTDEDPKDYDTTNFIDVWYVPRGDWRGAGRVPRPRTLLHQVPRRPRYERTYVRVLSPDFDARSGDADGHAGKPDFDAGPGDADGNAGPGHLSTGALAGRRHSRAYAGRQHQAAEDGQQGDLPEMPQQVVIRLERRSAAGSDSTNSRALDGRSAVLAEPSEKTCAGSTTTRAFIRRGRPIPGRRGPGFTDGWLEKGGEKE